MLTKTIKEPLITKFTHLNNNIVLQSDLTRLTVYLCSSIMRAKIFAPESIGAKFFVLNNVGVKGKKGKGCLAEIIGFASHLLQ